MTTPIMGTPIMGPPTASFARCAYNLLRTSAPHARFIDEMFSELWAAALRHGIDPVVMIAQSAKETGAGHYAGRVPPTFFNTCGLKIREPPLAGPDTDAPMAHAQFASWWLGAEAHAQHLRAYCQLDLPPGAMLVDPRWVWVRGAKTPITTVEDLGGRWAPSVTYGTELAAMAARLAVKSF